LETGDSLARIARRLNRLGAERALFWLVGSAAFAVALSAATAGRLSPTSFRLTLLGLVLAVLAIALACALQLRRRRADAVFAARWVEARVPLDERLLTFASARADERESRLWPVLEDDNSAHAPSWAGSPLGIPRVPANALFLAAGLAAALLSLLPGAERTQPPPEATASDGGPTAEQSAQESVAAALGGGVVASGLPGGGSAEGVAGVSTAAPLVAAVEGVRTELARRFEQSIAASVLARAGAGEPGGTSGAQLATRGKPERGGVGSTKSEDGGRTPHESMARLEQDDGSGQPVRGPEPEGGSGSGRPTQAGANPQGGGEEGGQGDSRDGGAGKAKSGGRGRSEDPKVAADFSGEPSGAGGGAGAGAGKANAALLAQKRLTLAGDRQSARFALTIGAGTRDGAPSEGEGVPTQPRSRIADVERGAQVADRSVRHEEIPPEYESVVKRIFAREP
jgi:hypothetical protein